MKIIIQTMLLFALFSNGVFAKSFTINSPSKQYTAKFFRSLVVEVFKRENIEVTFVDYPLERAITLLDNGLLDADGPRNINAERYYNNTIKIKEHFLSSYHNAFSKKDLEVSDWKDLQKHKVGYVRGWKIFDNNLTSHANVTKVTSSKKLFEMLQRDRIDVALSTKLIALPIIKKEKFTEIKTLEPTLLKLNNFLYLHKKHEALSTK